MELLFTVSLNLLSMEQNQLFIRCCGMLMTWAWFGLFRGFQAKFGMIRTRLEHVEFIFSSGLSTQE